MWLKAEPDEDMGQLYSWSLYFSQSKENGKNCPRGKSLRGMGSIIMMGGAASAVSSLICLKGVIPLAATGIAI